MNIDIPGLLRQLSIDDADDRIRSQADTVRRLSKQKCPNLDRGESLRSYVATDLALGMLGIPFSREKLIKAANSRDKLYHATYGRIQNLLRAQVVPRSGYIEQLAVIFNGGSAERSRALLLQYQGACRSTVTAEKRDRLDYDTPHYHAAAFYVATVEAKVKVSQLRNKVAAVVKMTPQDLDRLSVDMVKHCGLGDVDYIARAFRLNPSDLEDRGRGGNTGKGKGKRLSPPRGLVGDDSDASPTTTRLGANLSPSSPTQSGIAERMPEKHLDSECRTSLSRAQGSSSNGRLGASSDTTIPLKSLIKRLRTLHSSSYAEWSKEALL